MKKQLANVVSWSLMFIVPLLFLSCTGSSSNDTQEITEAAKNKVPSNIMKAAMKGLTTLPKVVPTTPDGKLTLGEFFEIHTMPPDAVLKAQKGVGSLIKPNGLWFATVHLDGKPHLVMTLDKMNGTWKAVSFGGDGFAKELTQIREAWPNDNLTFVRCYQATADVVQVRNQKGQEVGYVPLTSAIIAYHMQTKTFNAKTVLSDSKVLEASKEAITAAQSQY